VYEATTRSGERVALKQVLDDPRHIQREAQMCELVSRTHHPNIALLIDTFETKTADGRVTNLVLEYVSMSLSDWMKRALREHDEIPPAKAHSITRQVLRGLRHIHSLSVCHRDLKPANILVSSHGHAKLCDFGSAKVLRPGETSTSYIVSRCYRAPELLLETSRYDTKVDVWSLGCIYGEMLGRGEILFKGKNTVDQLVVIMLRRGSMTRTDLVDMLGARTASELDSLLRERPRLGWSECGLRKMTLDEEWLLESLLSYSPVKRPSADEALGFAVLQKDQAPIASLSEATTPEIE